MFIDIHMHTRNIPCFPRAWDGKTNATPAQVVRMYDSLDIERGVILPDVSPECSRGPQSIEEVLEICETYSPRFIPFTNVDPRWLTNSPDAPLDRILAFYREKGCRGVGESMANLPFDHPMTWNLFTCCEKAGLPLTFHIAPAIGGYYGIYDEPGLPLLEKSLEQFPDLVFLGHSQAFWAEIGPLENVDDRGGYPEGPVKQGGRVVELMRTYPNLHGDLSANSGFNAVSRDEVFGAEFMDEFRDRLYFGTDITTDGMEPPLGGYLLKLRNEKKISEEIFQKIAKQNAEKLLKL